MIFAGVLLVGFVLGFLSGRWWLVLAPVVFGLWIAAESDVDEVPPWFLGSIYALVGVIGVVLGVFLRQRRATADS